jgi:hypothetical protein
VWGAHGSSLREPASGNSRIITKVGLAFSPSASGILVLSLFEGLDFDRSVTVISTKLRASAFLAAQSALAIFPFPVASTTCETCHSGSFTKIADNESFDQRGRWRGAGLWCYKITALVSGQESAPTQITVSALASEHSGRFIGRTHR